MACLVVERHRRSGQDEVPGASAIVDGPSDMVPDLGFALPFVDQAGLGPVEDEARVDGGGLASTRVHIKEDLAPSGAAASLLEILGDVVETQADLDRSAPLLLETIELDRNLERAAAFKALAEIGRHDLSLPASFTDSVLKALQDEYLIIVRAAITAIPRIDVPPGQKPAVAMRLLEFAASYGPKRAYTEDVLTALYAARRLAKGELYQAQTEELMLGVVATFPGGEAVEILNRLNADRDHPAWPVAAVAALQPDPDPNWYGVHDHGREDLLRELAAVPTGHLAPLFDELEKIGLERLPHEESWAWAVSDVFARHGEHARAAAMCDAVFAAMPDTTEHRPRRGLARQMALGHHLDAAVVAGDATTAERLMAEWATFTGEGTSG